MMRSCMIPVNLLRKDRAQSYYASLAVIGSLFPVHEQETVTRRNLEIQQQASNYRKRRREEERAAKEAKAVRIA